jgi:uncharacterized protein YjbI with pentapeptide repeats
MGARFERALAALADFCRRHKVVVGIVVGLALFAAIVWVPKLGFVQPDGLTKAADRAKAESDFRGHLIQAIGGLVLAAGAYFTGRTFALNREGQHTERFTRAIDQLADEKLDIRLGGIHALDRIAHDSKTYYLPVMEVLTAFLRENARWRDSLSQAEKEPSSLGDVPALRSDLQAAATVVARRDLSTSEAQAFRVNLFGADLTGAYLPDAKLTEANLRYVNLSDAILRYANLFEAQFGGGSFARANFFRADLRRTVLTTSTDFTNAVFMYADLRDSSIPGRLEGLNFSFANLAGASLDRSTMIGVRFDGADFTGADLSAADLRAATGLGKQQLESAITDENTKLPAYLTETSRG